jgi:hypothetical protein
MLQRTKSNPRALLLLAMTLLVSACAPVKIQNSWKDPEFSGPLRKVFVVGIARSDTNRRLFEDSFSRSLQNAGNPAVSSYTRIPETGQIDREQVRVAVTRADADAVMVTRLVRAERGMQPGYSLPAAGTRFNGWYREAAAPTVVNQYDLVTLETTLWDVKSEKIIWSATSEIFNPNDVPTATGELAKVLIEKMRKDGVL